MASVNQDFPDHAMALLQEATDAFRRDLQSAVDQADLPAYMQGVRGSQIRLLQLTPRDGLRATDLAARARMTKQALGEFARELEELGMLESVDDPNDRRVRIWRPTARGLEAAAYGDRVIASVERAWRRRIGAREWDALRGTLSRMVDLDQPPTARSRKDSA